MIKEKQIRVLTIIIAIVFTSCKNDTSLNKSEEVDFGVDTLNAVKIGTNWVIPKETLDFNSLIDFQADTLGIVTCSEYVYSPFGQIANKTELESSKLNNFVIRNILEEIDNEIVEIQKLSLGSNRLVLFFANNLEGPKTSYIFKGEVFDSKVVFDKNIKIGMSIKAFFDEFFDAFPEELHALYQTVIFESCVNDINHTYSFKNGILKSVKFESDSHWEINYE